MLIFTIQNSIVIPHFQTRILVTHGINFLPQVDLIVVLDGGTISEMGSYQELLSHQGPFSEFLKNYLLEVEDEDVELQDLDEDGIYIMIIITFITYMYSAHVIKT